ncbi:SH3 domain [Trinorchestia longiramus]|nr:SH3 domain [Trinorchestia longiramus]
MIDSDNEEYVKVIEDFSYSHEGRNHRIYRHDIYLVLEKRQDWWRVVCSRRKVIWAPKSYLVPTNPTLQQQKDALRAKFQGSRREHNTAHAAAPHTDEAPMGLSSAAHVKNDKGNASAKHTLMGPQEDTPRRDFVPQNHLPTKEELTISHQNLVEQQHQLALSKEEPFLLSRKMSKKKDQKLSKKDISHPTLNSYNQPHFEIKDSHAASKKIQKITKDDISRPIFCSYNYNSSQTLPSPPVASTFKPFSDAMLNSDHNKNPLNAAKPFLGAGSSNRSSRLSLYDGSCSSDSLEDILEENSVASGLKNNPYNSLDAEKNVKHPINGRKASSDERLDSPSRSTDQRHLFSQLSPRNRSNSVDLKSLSKDRVFNDPNDNVVKSSKAGENERNGWRRSLALEEYRAPSNRNAPVQDDFDASHWLDPPPSLPPKKNRSTISLKDSRPGKVIQSNAETSPSSVKRLINDNFEPPKHDEVSRENSQSSEPQQLLSSRRGHKLLQHRTQFESKGKIELNKPYACFDCKDATCLGECCHVRDQQRTTSQALKNHTKNDLPSSIALNRMTRSYTCVGNFPSTESNFDNNVRASKRSEQTHNPNGSALKRNDETKRSFKESATGNVRKNSFLGLFQRGSSKNDPKRRETSSALGLDGGGKKLPQCPPSPDANHEVKRKLDDNWLEYWYPEYKCSFYYNEVTKEKKWKPPRRRLQKQVPVDELELQDRLAWSGLSAADSAPTHLTPEYSTQRSMTPSSRTSSVGSLSENSSQLALQLQPPSIDSHCSSIASSGPGINLTYGSHFATPTETEGSYGSSPDVTPCNCPSCVSRTHYSDRTIGSTCPHVDTGEARSYNASGPADHFNDHSLSNDGPVLPPRPPNGAKPQFSTSSDGFSTPTEPMMLLSGVDDCETGSALREALQTYTPEGWRKRTCSSRYIFVNMANGDKDMLLYSHTIVALRSAQPLLLLHFATAALRCATAAATLCNCCRYAVQLLPLRCATAAATTQLLLNRLSTALILTCTELYSLSERRYTETTLMYMVTSATTLDIVTSATTLDIVTSATTLDIVTSATTLGIVTSATSLYIATLPCT